MREGRRMNFLGSSFSTYENKPSMVYSPEAFAGIFILYVRLTFSSGGMLSQTILAFWSRKVNVPPFDSISIAVKPSGITSWKRANPLRSPLLMRIPTVISSPAFALAWTSRTTTTFTGKPVLLFELSGGGLLVTTLFVVSGGGLLVVVVVGFTGGVFFTGFRTGERRGGGEGRER